MTKQSPWHFQQQAFGNTLEAMDKWLHLAVYLGLIAQELGADRAEIDRLICCASKAEIDRLLLAKLKNGQHDSQNQPNLAK